MNKKTKKLLLAAGIVFVLMVAEIINIKNKPEPPSPATTATANQDTSKAQTSPVPDTTKIQTPPVPDTTKIQTPPAADTTDQEVKTETETETQTTSVPNVNQETPSEIPSSEASQIAQTQTYTFRNQGLFDSHYEKHGAEFGSITQEEYLALANQVIVSPTALHKTEQEDGDDLIYEEKENMFLVLSTDGYIRTFFRPDDGIAYYERQ